MKDQYQSVAGPDATNQQVDCAAVELWLADAAESALPAAIADQILVHAAGCAACGEKLAQARSGREWLLVLKQETLEPPADMVAKILARTSLAGPAGDADSSLLGFPARPHVGKERGSPGYEAGHDATGFSSNESGPSGKGVSIPAWQRSSVVVLRRTLLDPRLALVAAMAFFSISLTLNMLGFRVTNVHAADLTPRNMRRAVVRQYASTDARIARYYENLRIVYEVEARVQQLRRAAETDTPTQPGNKPRKQSFDSTGDSNGNSSTRPAPRPIVTSPRLDAALDPSAHFSPLAISAVGHTLTASLVPPFGFRPAVRARSCSLGNLCTSARYPSSLERRLA
jgi:hypothetical protein